MAISNVYAVVHDCVYDSAKVLTAPHVRALLTTVNDAMDAVSDLTFSAVEASMARDDTTPGS
jgi:hypothetical protein